jgi:hypothetical protein
LPVSSSTYSGNGIGPWMAKLNYLNWLLSDRSPAA